MTGQFLTWVMYAGIALIVADLLSTVFLGKPIIKEAKRTKKGGTE